MTPNQVKDAFRERGETFTSWAKRHGYPPNRVIRVVNGLDKGNFGMAHKIAVDLGIKPQKRKQRQPNTTILAEAGRGAKNVAAA